MAHVTEGPEMGPLSRWSFVSIRGLRSQCGHGRLGEGGLRTEGAGGPALGWGLEPRSGAGLEKRVRQRSGFPHGAPGRARPADTVDSAL